MKLEEFREKTKDLDPDTEIVIGDDSDRRKVFDFKRMFTAETQCFIGDEVNEGTCLIIVAEVKPWNDEDAIIPPMGDDKNDR